MPNSLSGGSVIPSSVLKEASTSQSASRPSVQQAPQNLAPMKQEINRPSLALTDTQMNTLAGRNIVINQPGMGPIYVTLQMLQCLRPGQGIPTNQPGHVLVKTENGQYQILKVGSTQAEGLTSTTAMMQMRPPVQQAPQIRAPMQQMIDRQTVTLTTAALAPYLVRVTSTPSATSPRAPVAGSGSGGGTVQKMTPDMAKLKCKNFLSTLLRLASDQPARVAQNLRALIQRLIDGTLQPEVFATELQHELNSAPQPCIVPFLKKALPFLQTSLRESPLAIAEVICGRSLLHVVVHVSVGGGVAISAAQNKHLVVLHHRRRVEGQ